MTEQRPEPLNELREQFRAAAAREMATPAAHRTRRRRRVIAVALAAIGATGGIAVATQLISVGSPRPDPQKGSRYRVPAGSGTIAITAPDRERSLPWGVLVYRSSTGENCAAVGHVRAGQLGELRNGSFRPSTDRSGGACRKPGRAPFVVDVRYLDGRSLVFGRARDDVESMRANYRGRTRQAKTGAGGAFLFVFDAGLRSGEVELTALGADGRALD